MNTESFEKLCRYKTAYSPVWEQYVGIVKVRRDEDGVPIVEARIAFTDTVALFRQNELTNYVL
jgi:hypothetical protein